MKKSKAKKENVQKNSITFLSESQIQNVRVSIMVLALMKMPPVCLICFCFCFVIAVVVVMFPIFLFSFCWQLHTWEMLNFSLSVFLYENHTKKKSQRIVIQTASLVGGKRERERAREALI